MATSPRSWREIALALAFASALVGGVATCSGSHGTTQPAKGAASMKAEVDVVFERLAQGQLSPARPGTVDGWETELPTGVTVARSTLQSEAGPLIALGPEAVPALLPWVRHANAALRYVAVFALGEITGEHPQIGHFDNDPAPREQAISVWRAWYDHHVAPGSAAGM